MGAKTTTRSCNQPGEAQHLLRCYLIIMADMPSLIHKNVKLMHENVTSPKKNTLAGI